MEKIELLVKLADVCEKLITLIPYVEDNARIQSSAIELSYILTREISHTANMEQEDPWTVF